MHAMPLTLITSDMRRAEQCVFHPCGLDVGVGASEGVLVVEYSVLLQRFT